MTEPRYHVASLPREGEVDPDVLRDVFHAPWRGVSLLQLQPGEALGPRELDSSEAMLYVTAGTGRATLGSGPVELSEGIALTLFKDERLDIVAGDEALELFMAEMGVA